MDIAKTVTGKGHDVVVIHGGAASSQDMIPVVKAISERYCVTNIDLPGTGKSVWKDGFKTIHDIADQILTEMPDQATYIGWSFGGLVAQSIAARYPNRVKRLVGIGTTPKFLAAQDWPGFDAAGFSPIVKNLQQEAKTSQDFLKMFYEYEFEKIDPKPEIYRDVQKLWAVPPSISNELLAKRIAICDATDLRDLFKMITPPMDLIVGECDINVPVEAFPHIQALNPRVKIHLIKGAAHAPFWTHATLFSELLNQIL